MARGSALAAALAVSLLFVAGAGGADGQTPKRGGTVVVATNSADEPACLSFWLPVCDHLSGPGVVGFLGKVLALPFAPGPHALRPSLVERFEYTENPFTITFHIRPRARWSDGVPISARDFDFAYQTYLEHAGIPDDDPFRTAIRRVRAVGAKTVRFVFRAPYGDWKTLLNFSPLPSHVLRGEDLASVDLWRDRVHDPKTATPIASGPFVVGNWERGEQLTLVRNPRYWGRHDAYLERIVLRFVRGSDTAEALRSGEFDLGVVLAPVADLENDRRFSLLPTVSGGWQLLEFRVGPGGHSALKSTLVRRALAYGIDRAELARALFGASAPPVLDNTIFLTNEWSYEPNWSRYRYRPTEARRLLQQAGCSRGADGIYSCAGERLRLRFLTTAGVSVRERELELVKTQLRRVGVEVELGYAPANALFGKILPSGDFDAALFARSKLAPGRAATASCSMDDYSGYCGRRVEADLDLLDRTVDPARRVALANRIDRRLAADVPALPFHQFPFLYVVRERLQGVVANGFGENLWNAENWWLDD